MTATEKLEADCCIAGGGPAGMMLGFLLARAGVSVVILEKHADFLRDFRGDTIHPSTLEVMYQLGLLERFLQRPHDEVEELSAQIGETVVRIADFRHLPTHARFLAFMPQWDFLDFLAGEARRFDEFKLVMQAEVVDLVFEAERIAGVKARTPSGPLEVRAPLTIGADGRRSTVRDRAGLRAESFGAPMDVLWIRLPRRADDVNIPLGRIDMGRIFVMIARGDYFQCAYVVPKGGFDEIRGQGLETFRASVVAMAPWMADRVGALASWDDVKLLTVEVDRLETWARPGLLCIGDAAHAMSPVGGVGINLAIQDAVAASNLLRERLAAGRVVLADLEKVQRRRARPTRQTQAVQLFIQRRIIGPTLASRRTPAPPWVVKLLDRVALLRRIPARVVGLGLRFERVKTVDVHVR
ncbi:MAG: FAD-dependent oxidoreductase [Caulobacteraceae bacterium]